VVKIAESELNKLADRLDEDNDIELHWNKSAAAQITELAYSLSDGARPIKRFINESLVEALTEKILDGEISKGDTVFFRLTGGEYDIFAIDDIALAELQDLDEKGGF
jgi:ATP-dependent Clp protease ATP-binding subunit ClpB